MFEKVKTGDGCAVLEDVSHGILGWMRVFNGFLGSYYFNSCGF